MKLLLDTNIVIAIRKRDPAALAHLATHKRADVAISSVTVYELYFGAYRSEFPDFNVSETGRLRFLTADFSVEDAQAAGKLRDDLRRQGNPIGPYDVLIAGQALSRNLTLVTRNTGEFSRVPGLSLADWR